MVTNPGTVWNQIHKSLPQSQQVTLWVEKSAAYGGKVPFSLSAEGKTSQVKQGLSMAKAVSKHLISHLKIIITWLSVIKRRSLAAACPVSNDYRDGSIICNRLIGRLNHFND